MCCRPAKDLGEGRGVVRRYLLSVLHASDGEKWEIKRFGAAYPAQAVTAPVCISIETIRCRTLSIYPFSSAKECFGNGGLTRFTCKIDQGSRLFLLPLTPFFRGVVAAARPYPKV